MQNLLPLLLRCSIALLCGIRPHQSLHINSSQRSQRHSTEAIHPSESHISVRVHGYRTPRYRINAISAIVAFGVILLAKLGPTFTVGQSSKKWEVHLPFKTSPANVITRRKIFSHYLRWWWQPGTVTQKHILRINQSNDHNQASDSGKQRQGT